MTATQQVIIDGRQITDIEAFHQVFCETLVLGDTYGDNLDALFDVLTSLSRPTVIAVRQERRLRRHLGDQQVMVIQRLFQQAAEQNDALEIAW